MTRYQRQNVQIDNNKKKSPQTAQRNNQNLLKMFHSIDYYANLGIGGKCKYFTFLKGF